MDDEHRQPRCRHVDVRKLRRGPYVVPEEEMITIGYITARDEPRFDWFFDSLRLQQGLEKIKQVVVVDAQCGQRRDEFVAASRGFDFTIEWVFPKPNVWGGKHRLTKEDWWHVAAARNTWLCLATQPWCAALDDRCVLTKSWLPTILESIEDNAAVFGAYEKRHNIEVKNGVIVSEGTTVARDGREQWCERSEKFMPFRNCPPEWSYGCTLAFPTAWGMEINGWDETCDGASGEDVYFGHYLKNCGKRIRYDARMKIIEDRTPGKCGPTMRREDKGVSPNDKSHALLAMLKPLKRSMHQWDLNTVARQVQSGEPWPIPTGPTTDWFDGQPLSEM